LAKVDVADVEVRLRVAAANPPLKVEVEFVPVTVRNPEKVEVADEVLVKGTEERKEPPVRVRPLEEERPPAERPFANVDVPDPWTVIVEVAVSPERVVVPKRADP
jgi:hypothetical protein